MAELAEDQRVTGPVDLLFVADAMTAGRESKDAGEFNLPRRGQPACC